MNHFIISYAGNKRKEYKELKKVINLDGVLNIIEPFCGSSAISFNIWKEHGNKYNYYLNDKSKELMNLYDLMKTESPEHIEEEINKIKDIIFNKDDYLKIYKKINPTIYEYIYYNRYRSFRVGLFNESKCLTKSPFKLNKIQLDFIDFIKSPNVFITNNSWEVLFDQYKNDENSFFMLDPPYMLSENGFYGEKSLNVYEYFYENPLNMFKSRIYLMLENNWIIKLLFKDFLIHEYSKMYNITHKKTTHIIIKND